ncbi:hypothetical protein [Streptomyces sp. MK37H]|uniref:hypothetical protein n=1 Tax=Streptomyces sp. MK37H TaxID=2699117 RepID=UPI001B37DC3E|nr:hypothetical protein [Streptomyces sp. MK37H]MBP8536124.1 hypothetical protein [Streptomyces sp. MK37H]
MTINVRISLGSYDFAHPAEKQTQVYVQIPDVARVSYMLPAHFHESMQGQEWGDVLDNAHGYYESSCVVTDSDSARARADVRAWLAVDENRDALNEAWFQDRARRDPVSRSLLKDVERLRAETEHLRKDRDAFRNQRNGVFKTNERLIGALQEEQDARLRAENDVRTLKRERDGLRARVAELEAEVEPEPSCTVTESALAPGLASDESVEAARAAFAAAEAGAPSQVLPLAVDVPVPVVLTEQDGPAVVTAAARAAVDKLRRDLPLALPGGERS